MPNSAFPINGSCRCGQVKLAVSAPPLLAMACHCTGCQRMSSSAFSLSVAIPSEAFAVTEGEPVIGGLHGAAHHFFCPHCMSWIFTRMEGIDFFVNVRTPMLEHPARFPPFVETYTSEKLPFAETGAAHSFEKFPEMEAYEGLMKAYAAEAG